MTRYVDLSGPLESGLWGYHELPGLADKLPPVEVERLTSVDADGFFASRLALTTVSGCYVETGAHVLPDAPLLEAVPVERFFRPAAVMHLPEQPPRAVIGADLLERHRPPLRPGDGLVIECGWGRRWNRPGYVVDSPSLADDALDWVLALQPGVLAVDLTCIESAWSEQDEAAKGERLRAFFAGGGLLVAPLVNAWDIRAVRGRLVCLPLAAKQVSGAPARVVFVEEDQPA